MDLYSLPEWCHRHIAPTLSGDVEAARSLIFAAPNENRGEVVKALWKHGVSQDVLRAALQDAWDHDYVEVWNAFKSLKSFTRIFRAANFPVEHLATRFTIWRGGDGDRYDVAIGFSWTMDRDTACWFALRFDPPNPLVVTRTVQRRNVLAHFTERDEAEIVVVKVGATSIDGDVSDWRQGYERWQHKKEEKQRAWLAASSGKRKK